MMDKDLAAKMKSAVDIVTSQSHVSSDIFQEARNFLLRQFREQAAETKEPQPITVTISAEGWLQDDRRVREDGPVGKVILTTMPAIESKPQGDGHWYYFRGRSDRSVFFHDKAWLPMGCDLVRMLLEEFWPAIEFVLPSGETT